MPSRSVGNLKKKKIVGSYGFFSCLEKLESVGRVKKKDTGPCHNIQGPNTKHAIIIGVLYS